ncbi:MAG: murein biosynthesis integral membrane protein MurJ, partial [Pseudomonadota bacterium]|nr:murein biosynthesis integral membrane protein MurJ [Pseudomonadota bacterium]
MSAKLLKSAFVISAMTLLSRISGLIRDVLFANILGSQAAADAFFVAFRLPNFFRRIFGEGAFAVAFVPVFSEYRIKHPPDDTRRFLELMTGRFGLTLLLVTLVGVLAAPALVAAIAPGFLNDPEKYRLAVDASRITFPYLFFISLVAMSAGMLNSCDRFAAPAATPVLLNLSLIGAALFLVPVVGNATIALSIGVLVAGLAQLLFQLPFLKKEGLVVKPRVARREGDEIGAAGVKQVLRLTLPALFGVSVAQINVLVNTLLASFLATGSISWLYYSDRLMEFPVGVFGIALSTAILPHLSRKHTNAAMDSFSH